jgi:hypothetical protein
MNVGLSIRYVTGQKPSMNRIALVPSLVGLSVSVLFSVDAIAATPPSQPASASVTLGQRYLDELKKPEYAVSSCAISPVFASDNMTVAVTADRVFSAGDVVIAVGGEPVDVTSKKPVGDLLLKHAANESVPVKIRRTDKEMIVTASCTDRKAYYDLVLEAAFAASKNDAAACADKMNAARSLHAPNAVAMEFAYFCALNAGRIVGNLIRREASTKYIDNSSWRTNGPWMPSAESGERYSVPSTDSERTTTRYSVTI